MQISINADSLPLTVLIAESASEPIVVFDEPAALAMALVERGNAALLDGQWDRPGIYLLLDPVAADGTWTGYVGKAPAGLRTRLQNHLKHKDHWTRALLVARDTTNGFNSAQTAWLESRLFDRLTAAALVQLHNGNRPSDETLPAYERGTLERSIRSILRSLRMLGYDTSAPGDEQTPQMKKPRAFYGATLKQLLEAHLVAPGQELTSMNATYPARATVTTKGEILYDGGTYGKPSAAAAVVRGGATNGWEFWGVEVDGEVTPLSVLRSQLTVTSSQSNTSTQS